MRIRPYISDLDFDVIKNWITDERTHAMWCANLIRYLLQKENFDETLEQLAVRSPPITGAGAMAGKWFGLL